MASTEKNIDKSITFNLNGDNSKVFNDGSSDNSVNNIKNINEKIDINIHANLALLRKEIEKEIISNHKKEDAFKNIDIIEKEIEKEAPDKEMIKNMVSLLPNAGNIASIGSLILSLLGG